MGRRIEPVPDPGPLMEDISRMEHGSGPHAHAVTGPLVPSAAVMKTKASVVWTCSLFVSLLVESCLTQKLNILWGPQSMMYLKGKYGKRFVSEGDKRVWSQNLQRFSSLLRGIQSLQDFEKPRAVSRLRDELRPRPWTF